MARKPNYRFEKTERERKKAAKKAEKAERAKAKAEGPTNPDETPGAADIEAQADRPKLSLWPK